MGQKTYDVRNFNGVCNATPATMYIHQAKEYRVEVVAPHKVIDILQVEVEGGILKISSKQRINLGNIFKDVVVNVWSPVYSSVSLLGSGDVKSKTPISADAIAVGISGSGDIDMANIEASSVSVNLTGSGDVELRGAKVVDALKIDAKGSGDVDLKGLPCKRATVRMVGSGDVSLTASEVVEGSVIGSGDLNIRGKAQLDITKTGSGDVKRSN